MGKNQVGYGIVCGFGPSIAHFPELAPGGVTIAVTANDILHSRSSVADIFSEVLASFGYAPAWPSVPMRVWADAARLARSEEVKPFLESFGGIQALRQKLSNARGRGAGEQEPTGKLGACASGITSACRAVPFGCCSA